MNLKYFTDKMVLCSKICLNRFIVKVQNNRIVYKLETKLIKYVSRFYHYDYISKYYEKNLDQKKKKETTWKIKLIILLKLINHFWTVNYFDCENNCVHLKSVKYGMDLKYLKISRFNGRL